MIIMQDLEKKEVADLISRFIEGEGEPYEWDDFISVRVKDPQLDRIRIICSDIHDKYPAPGEKAYCNADGFRILKRIASELADGRIPE